MISSLFGRLVSLCFLLPFSVSAFSASVTTISVSNTSEINAPKVFDHNKQNIEQLANHSYWLKLNHYLDKPIRGPVSTIQQGDFFLAANGKTSPYSELVASIEALYHPDIDIATAAQCKYPARYTWLESLQGRQAQLNCPELEEWRDVIDPEGLTLVFPTAFMNNPSSMFGHTLLRVDARDQTRHKELVAFAINFAAEPETQDNPALFAIKGLIGSYPGRFSVVPYYRKVREYNDMESRDIWEYKLNLSQEEVTRILLHLWELQSAEFDYYFLDENCSYQLLALLELANDDLSLISDFPLQAIPSDTVDTLANNNLLHVPKYRAAFGTRLLHQANQIEPSLFDAVVQAKTGEYPKAEKYTPSEQAAILELAYEWLNFELYDQALARDPAAKQLTQLLIQRSKINVPSPFSSVPVPEVSPEKGHGSARVGLGLQTNKQIADKATFEWRAAYHDLFDSQAGFIPGAQISFLDTQLSLDKNDETRLDKLYLLDAMALAPSNQVFDSLAWNIRTGFDRRLTDDKQAGRIFVQGGTGKAWGRSDGLHLYTLFSSEISHGELTDYDITLGLGVEAGILYQMTHDHRIGLQGNYLSLFDSKVKQDTAMTATWQWTLNRQVAIRNQVQYQHWYKEDISAKFTAYFYY
ncbi:DUF4105 domain-containing protein [Vibrio sp. TH_r3]|uniref:Lnb N-terminal periplasmic domain-containing protein n=1 Tax=Vibrio sp. TH_r3 TaxID=3082084 RepID=UPI002954C05B|nr:DUF4105 domain-containing protein [Vibrio sp. TH_r3]MDV7103624.1 DUF4105 domain-containing protein [Vibrio sp. TH_r3]